MRTKQTIAFLDLNMYLYFWEFQGVDTGCGFMELEQDQQDLYAWNHGRLT